MTELAVETKKLTKKFGDFTAVDGLDLKVEKGKIYGLLGPNGAGKTTTIKMLCGVLKITSGNAEVIGKDIPNSELATSIGYMPQETALYLNLTVRQNMEFYGEIFELSKDKIRKREKELLKFINLQEWQDSQVGNLSGGMKHRVSLACALMHEPEILFLDEPTIGIDPELRASFWNYFNKLKERGVTIFITTHYMDEARHCDRIGLMRSGRMIADGTPKELLDETKTESLEDAFLKLSKQAEGND